MERKIAGRVVGIPDSVQNTYGDESLSTSVWEGMSSSGRIRIQGSLGNQEMGDEFGRVGIKRRTQLAELDEW
jgi:hypothetical protein